MRWFVRSLIALAFAWVIFAISPYVALYSFAKALEARDRDAINERVNFHAVRLSITKQLVTAYLRATGREEELKGMGGRFVAGAGATVADPLVAEYVSPDALINLLNDRINADGKKAGLPAGGIALSTPGSLQDAWLLFKDAETRGFRAISFGAPLAKPAQEQFRIQFRLSGTTWRLVGIELPQALEQRLVRELIRRNPTPS